MPGGDRTGPMGQGNMTGRGMGYCAGNDRPGYTEPGSLGLGRGGSGRGLGRGFRRGGFMAGAVGRGFGRGFGAGLARAFFGGNQRPYQAEPQDEKEYLQNEADLLKQNLADIEKRLQNLENK